MVVASFTNSSKQYEVTIDQNGNAIDCECPDRFYRKHECKHMSNAQVQIDAEIAKAERFLALFARYDTREIERRREQIERETAASYARMFYYGI